MADLAEEMKKARDRIRVGWSEEASDDLERNLPRLRRRRAIRRATLTAVAALVIIGGGFAVWNRAPTIAARAAREVRFPDGSTAVLLSFESRLSWNSSGAELVHGSARFSVVHNPARIFRVNAGDVVVEVLGTHFTVERMDDRVRVSVESGRVRVRWADQSAELTDGQSDLFPREPTPNPVASPPPESHPKRARATKSWDVLAKEGDFDGAYQELRREKTIRDEPSDLLAAADVARLSHHPSEAVDPLQRMIRSHAADPRAPLAAFTLGRILLEDLGRPREAADAFVTAQRLASSGVLVPDALAREVEAWSRAGEAVRARERAEEYVRRFPDGSRIRSVRRHGGLE